MEWTKHSWKELIDSQQVILKDDEAKKNCKKKLSSLPSIVGVNEIVSINLQLLNLKKNKNNFIVHLGECSESFTNFSFEYVNGFNKLFFDISCKLSSKKIIKIARLAGQFAKPRSNLFEIINKELSPSYRGDLINENIFSADKRMPNLNRWFEAYSQSAITKSLIEKDIFISHESLLLDYEENFVKQNNQDFYTTSSHLLWVGKRTAFINSAHVEFVRGLINPIAFKLNHENLSQIESLINTRDKSKKTILIGRFGVDYLEENLGLVIKILKKYPHIIYLCDPMHGNTKTAFNTKYRLVKDVKKELIITVKYFQQQDLVLDGIMLEATYEDVLECVNSINDINPSKYKSSLDPRLNYQQTMDVIESLNSLI